MHEDTSPVWQSTRTQFLVETDPHTFRTFIHLANYSERVYCDRAYLDTYIKEDVIEKEIWIKRGSHPLILLWKEVTYRNILEGK